jgi:hypothetical protein
MGTGHVVISATVSNRELEFMGSDLSHHERHSSGTVWFAPPLNLRFGAFSGKCTNEDSHPDPGSTNTPVSTNPLSDPPLTGAISRRRRST